MKNESFNLNLHNTWFKNKDILSPSIANVSLIVIKNYDNLNKNKTKQWRKILMKLNVKLKTGLLVSEYK